MGKKHTSEGRIAKKQKAEEKKLENLILEDKTIEEKELEKAIFGDLDGFNSEVNKFDDNFINNNNNNNFDVTGLNIYDEDDISDTASENENESGHGNEKQEIFKKNSSIKDLDDDDLFFIDDGSKPSNNNNTFGTTDLINVDNNINNDNDNDDKNDNNNDEVPAWFDSDDERVAVSLLSIDRLKKLRKNENENFVAGKEYTKRLRNQYEQIYPRPIWADAKELEKYKLQILQDKKKHKKNKLINNNLLNENSDDNYNSQSESESESESDDEDDEIKADPLKYILETASELTINPKAQKYIPPSIINIFRLQDANFVAPSHSAVQTLAFHPLYPLLLTGGYDRALRIFHINGKTNPLAAVLQTTGMPIQTALFYPDGKRIFISGRRRYMYIWDIESGNVTKISRMYGHESHQRSMEKFSISPCGSYIALIGSGGWINFLSCSNGQWIASTKIEGIIADAAWYPDGSRLCIANEGGQVWEWDTQSKKIVARWQDKGGVGITKIAIGGPKGRYIAIGSKSGFVNLYDFKKLQKTSNLLVSSSQSSDLEIGKEEIRDPTHYLDQLVTTISDLKFSHDGQLLVMASRAKKDALKIVHTSTGTVYKNWPTAATPLGRVTSVAFSTNSELLAAGNEAGKVRLWRLNHYSV